MSNELYNRQSEVLEKYGLTPIDFGVLATIEGKKNHESIYDRLSWNLEVETSSNVDAVCTLAPFGLDFFQDISDVGVSNAFNKLLEDGFLEIVDEDTAQFLTDRHTLSLSVATDMVIGGDVDGPSSSRFAYPGPDRIQQWKSESKVIQSDRGFSLIRQMELIRFGKLHVSGGTYKGANSSEKVTSSYFDRDYNFGHTNVYPTKDWKALVEKDSTNHVIRPLEYMVYNGRFILSGGFQVIGPIDVLPQSQRLLGLLP